MLLKLRAQILVTETRGPSSDVEVVILKVYPSNLEDVFAYGQNRPTCWDSDHNSSITR